jgi:hypothetical protein
MKKLGIVITDGVGFRNFVMSDFIIEAAQKVDKILIYSGLPKSAYDLLPSNVKVIELPIFKESKFTWIFRKWKELAHLQRNQHFYGMKDNLETGYPTTNSARSIVLKGIYFISHFFHSHQSILFAEKLQFLSFSKNRVTQSYLQLLQEDKPCHVFFTHQRPSYLAPFLYAAIQSKISASTFIFSWDNLASKGRMLGTFDYFLVWSELMKSELLNFYPKVKAEDVKVVGTPQFEPYVMNKYKTEKQDFYNKFNLDMRLKTICFSCADSSIGQNDPVVISAIALALRENKIEKPCQFLVRTSPAEEATRFAAVKKEFPEILWDHPKWLLTRENHAEIWSQRVPREEDIMDLRAVLEYVDLNINMCSTMSLDFMLFDKPVINTVFGNLENGLYDDQRFLNYDHYKKVVDSESVTIATTAAELITQINAALSNPQTRATQRKAMIDLQISKGLLGTSKRIAKTLSQLND